MHVRRNIRPISSVEHESGRKVILLACFVVVEFGIAKENDCVRE